MNAMLRTAETRHPSTAATSNRCRLCSVRLKQTDHLASCICLDCGRHPEGRTILTQKALEKANGLTPAERSMVRSVSGVMAPRQLLVVLNERRSADGAAPLSLEQLREATAGLVPDGASPAGDWGSLRRMLASARRDGTLGQVDEQMIDDFAVIFSLSPAQWTHLKDVLLAEA